MIISNLKRDLGAKRHVPKLAPLIGRTGCYRSQGTHKMKETSTSGKNSPNL